MTLKSRVHMCDCEYPEDCSEMFDCCSCGLDEYCGCPYCFACNACDICIYA